jgi:Fe-S-cluster containining protein
MSISIPVLAEKITPENKCGFCTGSKCCTYITHQIDAPRSKEQFDYLLWQVSHENVALFKDEDGWFLWINNRCSHLMPDGRCAIYATRPQICRDHSNDNCEFDTDIEQEFDLYFDSYESLLKYCKKRFKSWAA